MGGISCYQWSGDAGAEPVQPRAAAHPPQFLLPNDTSRRENQSSASRGPEHQLLGGAEHPKGTKPWENLTIESSKFA